MAFNAERGANQVVTPAAASASVSISKYSDVVRLVNVGANVCHVRIGEGAQTATTKDVPIAAASEIIIGKGSDDDTVAYISAAGTTLHIQTGVEGAD